MKAFRLPRNETGSTLIEAMVAFAILAIVLVASAYAIVGALQVQTRTESRDKAVQLVQQQLEKARQVSFTELGFRPQVSGQPADSGYLDTPVNGLPAYSSALTAPACTIPNRIGCTVAISTLPQFESGVDDYQTERLIPWRELLFDEPGGVGGVDYVIRTNITYENPASYGVLPSEVTSPDRLAKRVTVTVYWSETIDDVPRTLETTMTMIRTPNPGEWKS